MELKQVQELITKFVSKRRIPDQLKEDVVQISLIKYHLFDRKSEISCHTKFLYRLVTNVMLDELKKEKKYKLTKSENLNPLLNISIEASQYPNTRILDVYRATDRFSSKVAKKWVKQFLTGTDIDLVSNDKNYETEKSKRMLARKELKKWEL